MVTLTLFFIAATPMITFDSCPHYQIDPLAQKTTLAAFFPKPNVEILLSDTEVWSLDKMENDYNSESNDQNKAANKTWVGLYQEKSKSEQLPNDGYPAPTPKNTHFFDRYLLYGSTDLPISKVSNCCVITKSIA